MVIVDESSSQDSRQLVFATQSLIEGTDGQGDSLQTKLHKRTLQKDIKAMREG